MTTSTALRACVFISLAIPLFRPASAGVAVPNPSFETGDTMPDAWRPPEKHGRWLAEGSDGNRSIAVSGDGSDSGAWYSAPVPMTPGGVYRLSFSARRVAGTAGSAVTGPTFCNRDIGDVTAAWQRFHSVFAAPAKLDGGARLRFGQWHLKGTVAYDDIQLLPVQPVHRRFGDTVLGAGESIAGTRYSFTAPFARGSLNHARPLAGYRCRFNSNRWCLSAGDEVIYRHAVGGRRQVDARVTAKVGWHQKGALIVEAAGNNRDWVLIGRIDAVAERSFAVPGSILSGKQPADTVLVRLRGGAGASLQVHGYRYDAQLTGTPAEIRGRTRYAAVTETDPGLTVTIRELGAGLPGGDNTAVLAIENTTGGRVPIAPAITLSGSGETLTCRADPREIGPGKHICRIDYRVPRVGTIAVAFGLGAGTQFRAETELTVAELHNSAYGRLLDAGQTAAVWWADAGWKISRTRPAPEKAGTAVRIAAARNEAEAAQLVVRPRTPLRGLRASASALRGPDGATISPDSVEILRVRYVKVEHPTDKTGTVGWWPDPLPPVRGGIDAAAGTNTPLWIRVKPPADIPAGTYRGTIRLAAGDYRREVPLAVTVYGFTLPRRMTCTTAFGFSPGAVWRYQNIRKPEDRRAVLEKYWRNFADHHISPYDPAPLDRPAVTWPDRGPWRGGRRVRDVKYAGEGSLKVADTSTTAQASAKYEHAIAIPTEGLRLRFRYRAARGHRFIVSLNHHDAHKKWMSGRNNDIRLTGTGDWSAFDETITRFPDGARYVRLTLWGALYADDGAPTGTVWYDDLSVTDAGSGNPLAAGGDFEPRDAEALEPHFDFEAWDRAMQRAIGEYGFNSFRLRIPGMGGGTFHARHEPSLLGYPEDTPEYRAAFGAYCRKLQAHLGEKGWLDEAFVYWFDEPAPKDYAFVDNGFRKLKKYAPKLRRMLTEQVEEELIGGPDIWCPVSHNYDHAAAEERRQHGEHFWWYVCCGPKAPYCTLFIDHPATELRVWLWQTWQRKIEGVLVWQVNYWTSTAAYPDRDAPQNPYEDPMGWRSGYSTPKGTRLPWGNGDGRFIYPPEAAADAHPPGPVLEGPVDSIRWEMLRDGIEDYEYLVILKRLLAQKGARLPKADRARFAALLEVPPEISREMTDFTTDPAPIRARREEIAKAIERLEQR